MKTLTEKQRRAGRIAIAKDVLKQLRYLKIGHHGYFSGPIFTGDQEQASKKLTQIKRCIVCALGACMISYVRLHNKISIDEMIIDTDGDSKRLSRFFSSDELHSIENHYEGFSCNAGTRLPYNSRFRNFCFNKGYDSKQILRLLMKNIVENGEFKPELLPTLK